MDEYLQRAFLDLLKQEKISIESVDFVQSVGVDGKTKIINISEITLSDIYKSYSIDGNIIKDLKAEVMRQISDLK